MTDEIANVTTSDATPKADAKPRKARKPAKPSLPKGASVTSLESLNKALAQRHKVNPMQGRLFRGWIRSSLVTTNKDFKGKRAMWSEGWRPTDADVKSIDAMYAARAARQAK